MVGLICIIKTMDAMMIMIPTRMSLIQMTNSGTSITSVRKRLTASPGESGNGAAPGRRRMYLSRFRRSR